MLSASTSSRAVYQRRGFRRVLIGAADPRLTPHAGVTTVTEVDRVLGITDALDGAVGPVKARRRGLTAGALLMSMASAQLAGVDFLVGMDRRRSDTAGQLLEPVPTPASTTTAQLAKRFTPTHLAGIENGIGVVNARVMRLLPARRRTQLLASATIDGDTPPTWRSTERRSRTPCTTMWVSGRTGRISRSGPRVVSPWPRT